MFQDVLDSHTYKWHQPIQDPVKWSKRCTYKLPCGKCWGVGIGPGRRGCCCCWLYGGGNMPVGESPGVVVTPSVGGCENWPGWLSWPGKRGPAQNKTLTSLFYIVHSTFWPLFWCTRLLNTNSLIYKCSHVTNLEIAAVHQGSQAGIVALQEERPLLAFLGNAVLGPDLASACLSEAGTLAVFAFLEIYRGTYIYNTVTSRRHDIRWHLEIYTRDIYNPTASWHHDHTRWQHWTDWTIWQESLHWVIERF